MSRAIGDLTVATALRDDEVLAKLQEMTGLSTQQLRKRLGAVHGRTRVRQALGEALPQTCEALSAFTVKQARVLGLAPEIARVWGLAEERVDEILLSAHGATKVGRAVAESDDQAEEGGEETPDLIEALGLDFDGSWSQPCRTSDILSILGFKVPQRLRTATFQHMLGNLAGLGVEARLDGDDDPLPNWARSPGIDTRLQLRIEPSAVEVRSAEQGSRYGGNPPLVPEDSRRTLNLPTDGSWSEPRGVLSVFADLHQPVPAQRLRAITFQRLLGALDSVRVQARLEGEDKPLLVDAPSPGILARLHLRLRKGAATSPPARSPVKPPRPAATIDEIKRGSVIESYRITALIGEGGFGKVFRAEWLHDPKKPAVVLKFARTAEAAESIYREAHKALRLEHPNVCHYRAVIRDPQLGTFLVMDDCGRSVDAIYVDGCQEIGEALRILTEASAGLDYLHKSDLLHGDVNPGNILVDAQGRVRLTDFGISVGLTPITTTRGAQTRIGTHVVGQHDVYSAPEVLRGTPGRRAADQYSLALVFCATLQGTSKFAQDRRYEFSRLKRSQNNAVRKALDIDPNRRFRSCSEFAEAMR